MALLLLLHLSLFDGVPKRPSLCFRRVGLGELSTEPSIEESFS
jgi:hypothetical protein